MEGSKYTTKGARVIAAQLYVAKGLKRNVPKMIKFIKSNREYFSNISDEMLSEMQKEQNITDEEIDKQENIEFANLQAERQFERDLLEKAEKIEEQRKKENRNHREQSTSAQPMPVYKDKHQVDIEEMFKKMLIEKSEGEKQIKNEESIHMTIDQTVKEEIE
jgi:hypothetical protein